MTKAEATAPGAVTVDNVDDEQLAQAAAMLGTDSPADTVNQALREVVRRRMIGDYVTLLKRNAGPEYEDARAAGWQSPTS